MADEVTLSDFPDNFGECFLPYKASLRQRIQGRKFANESYINLVKLYKSGNDGIDVKAGVYRSQRKNDDGHRVSISVGRMQITEAYCSCKAGASGECAHVLAVVLKLTDWILEGLSDIPSQPASTSLPQQWDRPRGTKIVAEPVSTMVISKPGNTNRKKRPLTADFVDSRKVQLCESDYHFLQGIESTPIAYLSCLPDQTVMTEHGAQSVGSALAYQLPLLQPVERNEDSTPCANLQIPHHPKVDNIPCVPVCQLKDVEISLSDAIKLEQNTKDQGNNPLWHQERAKRITASNFGRFMIRKAALTKKFVDSVMKPKPFTSAATSYGTANEKVARNMYRKKTNNHVHDCGLVVNPEFPYIGATPDGKVCDNATFGILEIKCPFSIRDLTVKEAIEDVSKSQKLCIEQAGETIGIKVTHPYWYQIQEQLLISGADFCDFVLYTRQDLFIQRVMPDKCTMEGILAKMHEVYSNFVFKQ